MRAMSHWWALVLVSPILLQDDPIASEALQGYRHPWADFRNGTTVTYRETTRRPDIDGSGKLIYKDVTNDVTWTVIAAEGEKATFRIEGGGQESHIPYFITAPSWARGKGERRGTEEIEVGGVKRTCTVTVISLDADKDAGQITTICKSPEVPYWAVRWRVETLMKGQTNTSEEEVVLETDRRVKVGDRELSCVVVLSTVETPGGVKTVRKEWRSDQVPGRVVRREGRQYMKGKEVESSVTQMEVVRFQSKR
jgi:hypothetical protein